MSEQQNQEGQVVSSGGGINKKRDKKVWTLQRCKKAAGRYNSEEAWKIGSPSSYKAAASHKWVKECLDHQAWRSKESPRDVSLPASA